MVVEQAARPRNEVATGRVETYRKDSRLSKVDALGWTR